MTVSGSSRMAMPCFSGNSTQRKTPQPVTQSSSASSDQFVRFGQSDKKDPKAKAPRNPLDELLRGLSKKFGTLSDAQELEGNSLFASLGDDADVEEIGEKPQTYLADEDYQDAIRNGDMDTANLALDWKIRTAKDGDFLCTEPMSDEDLEWELDQTHKNEMQDVIFSFDDEMSNLNDALDSAETDGKVSDMDKQQFVLEHRLARAVRERDAKQAKALLQQLDNLEAGKTGLLLKDWKFGR